jgi:hypothetical protein
MDLATHTDLVELGITKEALLQKFKIQLLREFELCDVSEYLIYSIDDDLIQLQQSIAQAIQIITIKENHKYQPLLYRVDISESQLNQAISNHTSENYFSIIAELIIKRVLQKVILKLKYSKPL